MTLFIFTANLSGKYTNVLFAEITQTRFMTTENRLSRIFLLSENLFLYILKSGDTVAHAESGSMKRVRSFPVFTE